jgi:AhpD family alkylhydroperoxidase
VELALPLIEPEDATGAAAELLAVAHQQLGVTPNLAKALANSPAALTGYLALTGALRGGELPVGTGERIALLVAQEHRCDYALSAHTFIGSRVAGLSPAEVTSARHGRAADARDAAALALAVALVRRRCEVTDHELAEVVAHIALNVFTAYFAEAARVAVDWPLATRPRRK